MLSSLQSSFDNGKIVGTVLVDLSKAYDCLPYDLIIAKLEAYRLNLNSLAFLHDYVSNRFHRVKIGNTVSEWLEIFLGIPQGSILGPPFLDIFLSEVFSFIQETYISNFADNSIYTSGSCTQEVIQTLQREKKSVLY